MWEAALELGKGHIVPLCRLQHGHASVHGPLSCNASQAAPGTERRALGIRAVVALRCHDPVDAPRHLGRSPWYLPLGRASLSGPGVRLRPFVARGVGPAGSLLEQAPHPWSWYRLGLGIILAV